MSKGTVPISDSIRLSQRQYIQNLLIKFNMMDANFVATPIDLCKATEGCPCSAKGANEKHTV